VIRHSRNATITYEWESPDGYVCEFSITGVCVPYVPASMYGGPDHLGWPAEGGGVEDIEVKITSITTDCGVIVDIDDTTHRKQIEDAFERTIEKNDALRERIETALCQAADRDCEPPDPDHEDY
jgi:hypothetical protein